MKNILYSIPNLGYVCVNNIKCTLPISVPPNTLGIDETGHCFIYLEYCRHTFTNSNHIECTYTTRDLGSTKIITHNNVPITNDSLLIGDYNICKNPQPWFHLKKDITELVKLNPIEFNNGKSFSEFTENYITQDAILLVAYTMYFFKQSLLNGEYFQLKICPEQRVHAKYMKILTDIINEFDNNYKVKYDEDASRLIIYLR